MFVLMGFRKDDTTKVIAVDQNREVLHELMLALKPVLGLRDFSEGIWDREEIKGRVWIEKIEEDGYQRGVDFFNYRS